MNEPSLDGIIVRLQSCIADAKALELEMLERLLSIALLEAHDTRQASGGDPDNGNA